MANSVLDHKKREYEEQLKGWQAIKWRYILVYPLFAIAYYRFRLWVLNRQIKRAKKSNQLATPILLKSDITRGLIDQLSSEPYQPAHNGVPFPFEGLGKDLPELILFNLNKQDLYSAAQSSRALFYSASKVQRKRNRIEQFVPALIIRDFEKAGELLSQDHSLASMKLSFKANDYFDDCPEKVMTAYQFAYWLGDEPMKAMIIEKAQLSKPEVERQTQQLTSRKSPVDDKLDAGWQFAFAQLVEITDAYVKDPSAVNWKSLDSAYRKCPQFVLDAFGWVLWKRMREVALANLDVYAAARELRRECGEWWRGEQRRGGDRTAASVLTTYCGTAQRRFLHFLNRIVSGREQSAKSNILQTSP